MPSTFAAEYLQPTGAEHCKNEATVNEAAERSQHGQCGNVAHVLAHTSRRRDIIWLANEAAGVVYEVATPALSSSLRFVVGRTHFTNGQRRSEVLALAQPHGAELAWL